MLDEMRFDPQSGAPLSDLKHYPGTYNCGVRIPDQHPDAEWTAAREGALTNGELVSAQQGLLGYFRRSQRQQREEPEPAMDRAAALALKRLRSEFPRALDAMVWYALAERLARKGFWASWMLDHANPRCPHPTQHDEGGAVVARCGSRVKFRAGVDHLEAICASSPSEHGAVDERVRERVASIYRGTFDEPVEEGELKLL